MRDVLVTENIAGDGMDALKKRFDVALEPQLWKDQEALLRVIGAFRAIVVRNQTKVDRELIMAAKNLLVIGRAGVGLDNVDVAAASERGVVVAFTPEQNAISVAELTLGLMLSLARHIPMADVSTKAGKWERQVFTGTELFGKTLGLIGLGRIGLLVATRARAFGMKVIAHDAYVSPDSVAVADSGATLVSMDELLSQADVISVHVPKTPLTQGFIDAGKLAVMKRNVLFINTSRGEVVNESALLAALKEKRIAGAALDVRAQEPPSSGELEALANVILVPHIGAFTMEGQKRVVTSICGDVAAVLRGEEPKHFVNFARPRRA